MFGEAAPLPLRLLFYTEVSNHIILSFLAFISVVTFSGPTVKTCNLVICKDFCCEKSLFVFLPLFCFMVNLWYLKIGC